MARPFGTVETKRLSDNTISFRGRFPHEGERPRVVFGRDADGWTEARARQELDNIRVLLRAGISLEDTLKRYEPPSLSEQTPDSFGITFHEYASEWFKRRCRGELGEQLPSEKTRENYLWCLSHLLPFFADKEVAKISKKDCEQFRGKLFADSEALRLLIEAGGRPTHPGGQPRKPLAVRSIHRVMALLALILEEAVEDELRTDNPARSRRLRMRVPKPKRTFLEIDQVVALLDAAHELESTPRVNSRAKLALEQADEIRTRLAAGETQYVLRKEYGLSSGAMSFLAQGKTYQGESNRIGWRVLLAVLVA